MRIGIHLLHDGRVALELMSDWYTNLDLQMLHVDETAAITSLIQSWAAGEYGEPKRHYLRHEGFPELCEAFRVDIGRSPSDGLRRFTNTPERLCGEFERAFTDVPSENLSDAARFAHSLVSEMQEFLWRSRHRAEARLAGGAYLKVLEAYLADMRSRTEPEDQDYYRTVETGIGVIMRDEQYLRLSPDPRVRELYQHVQVEQNALYQWWMNLSKGDKSGAR